MSIEKQIESVEEKVEDRSLAYEILQELKESGRRWQRAFFAVLILLGLTIAGFVWLWNQYDTVSSVEATGIYAAGNNNLVTSQDVSEETWKLFMEWMNENGYSKGDENQNP